MTRLLVGPFNRVEGDLEIRLDCEGGRVERAEVVSPLFRGFERMLAGRAVSDALVFAPRICGICSVSQSIAAARAIAGAAGIAPTRDGQLAINLIHAAENVADHLTHFYLFFMPDFTRSTYAGRRWHSEAADRFAATKGFASAEMLGARAAFLRIMGVLAGKWPHTLGIRPGGTTKAITGSMKAQIAGVLFAFRRFLERRLFGDSLETVAALASCVELDAWAKTGRPARADMGLFLQASQELELERLGQSGAAYLSYGAYPGADGPEFGAGRHDGERRDFDPAAITEDTAATWYEPDAAPRPPHDGVTRPGTGDGDGYTWCKAPRLSGTIAEVGALARQVVAGHRLARDLASRGGGVQARVVARLLEIALVTMAMERWVEAVEPTAPFILHGGDPASGHGTGLTEAARGALGHWLRVEDGRIANYQIIAPTTWNFSPRDGAGQPGPLERALVGAPIGEGEKNPASVLHIVRSFDPCMVCTVH